MQTGATTSPAIKFEDEYDMISQALEIGQEL